MAVESSPDHNLATRSGAVASSSDPSITSPITASPDASGMLPGERIVSELNSNDDGRFQLTHARVIFNGGSQSENGAVYASAQLKDISSIQISRRPRARRSAAWGIVGLFAAVGVWQVTPDSRIGVLAAGAVAIISLILMADYWIRPAGVHLEFHTSGGHIAGEVGGSIADAAVFVREVENAKRRLVPGRVNVPYRNYPSG